MIVRTRKERQVQKEWGGSIAIYLFLGGVGGGAYAFACIATLLGQSWAHVINSGLMLSFPVVIVGMLFLLSHLGSPMRAPLAMAKLGTSWISRGVWILSIFIVLSLIHFAGQVTPADFVRAAPAGSPLPVLLSILGLVFALFTMLYTGALLSGAKGVPLWQTAVLPALFIISGLFTGLCAVLVGMVVIDANAIIAAQAQQLAGVGAVLIAIELLLIMAFLNTAYRTRNAKESAKLIVGSGSFIFGDLIVGLLVPLVIFMAIFFGMSDASGASIGTAASLAGILGLIGGFLLRKAILSAGMATSLDMAGFTFRPIANLDFEHSPIGKMPPQ
jgi:formate-dependent nitrite reductase membrane component NrfD